MEKDWDGLIDTLSLPLSFHFNPFVPRHLDMISQGSSALHTLCPHNISRAPPYAERHPGPHEVSPKTAPCFRGRYRKGRWSRRSK